MSLVLAVGVLDGPHASGEAAPDGSKAPITIFELAEILEAKYALFSQFVDLEFDYIEDVLETAMNNQIDALMNSHPVPDDPWAEVGSALTKRFKLYLETEEIVKSGVPGVPTAAALAGKNSRLKTRKGMRRPSFIDTSVLYASLKVWMEANGNAT